MRTLLTSLITASALTMATPILAEDYEKIEAAKGLYVVEKTHASLTWKVSHMGLSYYTARFTKFDAELDFDPANPEKSTLTATIDPTSIETDYRDPKGEKDFNAVLVNDKGWFNAGEHPEITFTSTEIIRHDENTGVVTGNLEFLGQSHPVSLDVTFNKAMINPFTSKRMLGFSASGTLDRTQWGMTKYTPNIGADVQILIEVEFEKG